MTRTTVSLLVRLAALAMLLGATAALTFGYLGWVHPAFDSFSHFRVHLAAALIVGTPLLLILRFKPEALFAALLGTTAIVQTTGVPLLSSPTMAATAEPDRAVYRLMHANLRYDNPNTETMLSLIGQLRPDVMTLVEVSSHWQERLGALEAAYPYRIICPRPAHIGGAAILSRRPFTHGTAPYCGDRGAFAHAAIDFGGRAVEVAALHLGWPWPFEQPWQLPRVTPLLGQVGHTAVIAGDFNAVPWSQTARRVETAANAHLLRGIGPTWLTQRLPDWMRPTIGLPIDNMMVKGGVLPLSVGVTATGGSDHLPVMLEFSVLPEERSATVLQAAAR